MTPGINTLLLSTGALGSFTCSGMTLLIYMGPTALRGIRATGDTLSNVESQVFTPYKFGSTAGDRTPDLLTTRPTCYHSATALWERLIKGYVMGQPWTSDPIMYHTMDLRVLNTPYISSIKQIYKLYTLSAITTCTSNN